jgi:hypothetical protein
MKVFKKDAMGTFSAKFSSLSDSYRREQNLPYTTRMKQISAR